MSKQGIASIGMKVTVNEVEMNYVQEIGDIGGTPSELDATCLKDTMKKNVPGVQDTKSFEVTYLFDNSAADSDYRKLKAAPDRRQRGGCGSGISRWDQIFHQWLCEHLCVRRQGG